MRHMNQGMRILGLEIPIKHGEWLMLAKELVE